LCAWLLLCVVAFTSSWVGAQPTGGPIVVGCDRAFPPFEFVDDRGGATGFDVELLRAVAAAGNLKVRFEPGVWAEVRGRAERGEVRIVCGMSYSPERDKLFDFSVPFLSMQSSVFWRKGQRGFRSAEDLNNSRVAAQLGSPGEEFLRRSGLRVDVMTVESPRQSLQLLANGRVDYAFAPKLEGLYFMRALGIDNLDSGTLPSQSQRYCFAVREGDLELLGRLNEGLGAVKASGEFDRIYARWLGDLEATPISSRRLLAIAAWVALPLLVLLAGAGVWTWTLKRKVDQRTALLRTQLAERERIERALRETESRFRALAESAPFGVLIFLAGRLVYANPAVTILLGYSAQDLADATPWQYIHPDHVETVRQQATEHPAANADLPARNEVKVLRNGGGEAWVDCSVAPISLNGQPALIMTFFDITEAKRARDIQAALYEISQAAHAAESLDDLFGHLHRVVGRLMDARNFYIALHDRQSDRISFPYFVDERDSRPAPMKPGRGLTGYVFASGKPLLATDQTLAKLSAAGEFELLGSPSAQWLGVPLAVRDEVIGVLAVQSYSGAVGYTDADREILAYVSTQAAQAIERKGAEQALRESQRALATLMSNMPGMAYRCRPDPDWTFEFVSDGCVELTGFSKAEIMANPSVHLTHEADRTLVRDAVAKAIGSHGAWEVTYRLQTKACTLKWVWERGRAVYDENGAPLAMEGLISDISARKAVEEALRSSEERYRLALQATHDIMYDRDLTNGVLYWNPSVEQVLGYSLDEMGTSLVRWTELLHPADRARVEEELSQALTTSEVFTSEYRLRRKKGDYALIFDRGLVLRDERARAIRMVGAIADLTSQRQLEAQLRQAQKMEAVGQLAGGIAHDFNNLLLALLGSTELLQGRLPSSDPAQKELATIKRTALRATELTRALLAYGRRQVLEPVNLDLNDLIHDTMPMLRRVIPENIQIELNLDSELWTVRADPTQITQILLNLCVNARDAMPKGGTITIATGNSSLDESASITRPEIQPGQYACLLVTDTGQGIAREDLPHIFEPFFSTKELGKGTGLGLSTAYGIVKQHNGFIYAYSDVGRGTTFRVYLPRVEGAKQALTHAREAPAVGGTETILVVEDEVEVRDVLVEVLKGLGYTVHTAGDGVEALAFLKHTTTHIDLVLTDVVMPRMGGVELCAATRRFLPDLRFLFSSGYAEDILNRDLSRRKGVFFLGKPYSIETLARKMREALR
jgi:PAS domain S-box-containing protein